MLENEVTSAMMKIMWLANKLKGEIEYFHLLELERERYIYFRPKRNIMDIKQYREMLFCQLNQIINSAFNLDINAVNSAYGIYKNFVDQEFHFGSCTSRELTSEISLCMADKHGWF